ncbi:MAG: hypothetical protein QNL68_13605 [Akkermansiaceae bacterium]
MAIFRACRKKLISPIPAPTPHNQEGATKWPNVDNDGDVGRLELITGDNAWANVQTFIDP